MDFVSGDTLEMALLFRVRSEAVDVKARQIASSKSSFVPCSSPQSRFRVCERVYNGDQQGVGVSHTSPPVGACYAAV
ncbi:hypothetical protein CBOM_07551 [Ceraceosorus bombacis]|uniref:Uncharacterized protein n=1 Tax=Ceraceosorus bombacis TaxID=401625 RepID=A0A0P1BF69_9BASI|nr:hypothetical protein CBOM_07551 [Ceraceosorus bombacis]